MEHLKFINEEIERVTNLNDVYETKFSNSKNYLSVTAVATVLVIITTLLNLTTFNIVFSSVSMLIAFISFVNFKRRQSDFKANRMFISALHTMKEMEMKKRYN